MTRARIILFSIMLPLSAVAQQPGVLTEWDVQKVIETIASQTARLQPLIAEIHPNEWTAKGTPDAYVHQWGSVRTEAQALKRSSDNLVREPARLTTAMDTYFRLQDLEGSLGSLIEGVRKYQNPALADLLRGVLAENDSSRRQLRQYVADLAATKEQEFKVVDKEAQRCREAVTRPGGAAAKKK